MTTKQITLMVSLLVVFLVLNILDLVLSLPVLYRVGPAVEGNPIPRLIYESWGPMGYGLFKVYTTVSILAGLGLYFLFRQRPALVVVGVLDGVLGVVVLWNLAMVGLIH